LVSCGSRKTGSAEGGSSAFAEGGSQGQPSTGGKKEKKACQAKPGENGAPTKRPRFKPGPYFEKRREVQGGRRSRLGIGKEGGEDRKKPGQPQKAQQCRKKRRNMVREKKLKGIITTSGEGSSANLQPHGREKVGGLQLPPDAEGKKGSGNLQWSMGRRLRTGRTRKSTAGFS